MKVNLYKESNVKVAILNTISSDPTLIQRIINIIIQHYQPKFLEYHKILEIDLSSMVLGHELHQHGYPQKKPFDILYGQFEHLHCSGLSFLLTLST